MTDELKAVRLRLEAWANWLRRQQQAAGQKGVGSLLGALLGESMEAYRRGGIDQLHKPFACLIRGSPRPESQDDDAAEWEVQNALDAMPRYMREIKRVLYIEFMSGGPQEVKAKRYKISLSTYRSHLRIGLTWVDATLRSRSK